MAIPFILLALGVASGATGATLGVHSVVKIKDSKGVSVKLSTYRAKKS